MKDRDISMLDFFNALQREFISLEVRAKIYVSKKNKEYFWSLMVKKKSAIVSLSNKNNLPNIINDEDEYLKFWKNMVPKFGFPNLIYNINGLTEDQLKFPYHGSVVQVGERYGISDHVNFDDNTVDVIVQGDTKPTTFSKFDVKRLPHKETDEYFYYYPGNDFNTKENGIGKLAEYNMVSKIAKINFDGVIQIELPQNEVARIL